MGLENGQPGVLEKTGVLLVDDQPFIRNLIRTFLNEEGYTVHLASCASEAVELLFRHPGISVLLTDINMPGESGLDLIYDVRAGKVGSWPGMPIVILSGHDSDDLREIAAKLGVPSYLTKPVSRNNLLECLRDIVSRFPRPKGLESKSRVSTEKALEVEVQKFIHRHEQVKKAIADQEIETRLDSIRTKKDDPEDSFAEKQADNADDPAPAASEQGEDQEEETPDLVYSETPYSLVNTTEGIQLVSWLTVDELRPGHRIAKTIMSKNNNVLLRRGEVIGKRLISFLQEETKAMDIDIRFPVIEKNNATYLTNILPFYIQD